MIIGIFRVIIGARRGLIFETRSAIETLVRAGGRASLKSTSIDSFSPTRTYVYIYSFYIGFWA
ncbi:hypothetical protein Sjap_005099 [Stephania japonica]|uniref:Uncharacterized protein n=1 Tax=Stephania japonica TaxID=461633 RepID=A0AAP0PLI5_9MAGN